MAVYLLMSIGSAIVSFFSSNSVHNMSQSVDGQDERWFSGGMSKFLVSALIQLLFFYSVQAALFGRGSQVVTAGTPFSKQPQQQQKQQQKQRRRTAWILRLGASIVLTILGGWIMCTKTRNVLFSVPIEYNPMNHDHLSPQEGIQGDGSSLLFRRYDIVYQPSFEIRNDLEFSGLRWDDQEGKVVQMFGYDRDEDQEEQVMVYHTDRITSDQKTFFQAYDDPLKQGPLGRRLFFDLRFTPSSADGHGSQWVDWGVQFMEAFLVLDLVLGMVYFQEEVSFTAGWCHHLLGLWICWKAGRQGENVLWVLFFVSEVSAVIQSLGNVFPWTKPVTTVLYGPVALMTHLVLDVLLLHEMILNRPRMAMSFKVELILWVLLQAKLFLDWTLHRQEQDLVEQQQQESKASQDQDQGVNQAGRKDVQEQGTDPQQALDARAMLEKRLEMALAKELEREKAKEQKGSLSSAVEVNVSAAEERKKKKKTRRSRTSTVEDEGAQESLSDL